MHGIAELGKTVTDGRPALLAIKQTIPNRGVGKLVQQLVQRSRGLNALIHALLVDEGCGCREETHGHSDLHQAVGQRAPILLAGDLLPSSSRGQAVEDVGQR